MINRTPSSFFLSFISTHLMTYHYICISVALSPFPELLALPFLLIFIFMLFLYTINNDETDSHDSEQRMVN